MDELIIGLICVGAVVFILPLVAMVKASGAARDVDDLKRTVQRLEGTLDKLKDQFADTKPVSGPLGQAERPAEPKQAALAKPEPESVSLQKDLDVTLEPCPAPKTTLAPPPIIEPPKPAPPAKPTAIWAMPKATVSHLAKRSRLPKVDAQSIEMKLGTYWFVRRDMTESCG